MQAVSATAMLATCSTRRLAHREKMSRKRLRRVKTYHPSAGARPVPNVTARDLTLPAYERLERNMVGYGNVLNAAHREALMCIVGRFTMLASGATSGRWAYPLPCGGGKTQAVVAWCAELHHQRQPYSVLICQTQVEHLCELKLQMIKNGVPEDDVGLVHSYGDNKDKAKFSPTTGNEDRRILLATHQNIRTGQGIEAVNTFQGAPRSLVIWDESLLTSSHRSIEKLHLQQALGVLEPMVENNRASADLREAVATAVRYWKVIKAEFIRQDNGAAPREIILPKLSDVDLARLIEAIPNWSAATAVKTLLAVSQAPLRIVMGAGGGGLITYNVVVPRELANVAVLDASFPIRDLQRLDRSIKVDPLFHGDVKAYGTVTIFHLDGASGRKAMTEAFTKPRADRKVSKEIAQVVKDIPEDEGVLLFTFKHEAESKVDMAAKLRGDLQAEGIKVDAKLASGESRFAWLTWGNETSTSEFGYCRNVVFAGVLHRADVDLAGAIAGQRDDLMAKITSAEVEAIKRSEIAHSLLQALNRGSCRGTVDGKAEPMRAWLIHYDIGIRDTLSKAMPGLVWETWQPKHIRTKGRKLTETVKAITAALEDLPAETSKVTISRLKAIVGGPVVPSMTWTRALHKALEGGGGWALQHRSVARK